MKLALLTLWLAAGLAHAAAVTINYSDTCTISGPANAQVITCPNVPPPPTCAPYGGTPPNCTCIPPQIGTPPNCTTPGTITCTGFNHTTVVNESLTNPQTNVVARMGVNDAIVVAIASGPAVLSAVASRINLGEWQSTPSSRYATLSAQPCDFGSGIATSSGSSIIVYFTVGGKDSFNDPVIPVNSTYYLNVMNQQPANCASNGICDMFVSLYKGK